MPPAARKARPKTKKPGAKTRGYHHGDLSRALIEAALEILDEEGTSGLTLRAAARRAGVSHAAPKNHFGDLAGLLDAVAAVGFRQLATALRDARTRTLAASGGELEAFNAAGETYVRFALDSPGHFRAMFHPALGPPRKGGELEEASREAFGALVDAIAHAQSSGILRAGDVRELAISAWTTVHGLATLALDQHLARKGFEEDPIALFRIVSTNLVVGLAAR